MDNLIKDKTIQANDFSQHSQSKYFFNQPSQPKQGLLILSRRIGETICIGDDITLTILGIRGNQVRIGIYAPKMIPVWREEIYSRIQLEEKQKNDDVINPIIY